MAFSRYLLLAAWRLTVGPRCRPGAPLRGQTGRGALCVAVQAGRSGQILRLSLNRNVWRGERLQSSPSATPSTLGAEIYPTRGKVHEAPVWASMAVAGAAGASQSPSLAWRPGCLLL